MLADILRIIIDKNFILKQFFIRDPQKNQNK